MTSEPDPFEDVAGPAGGSGSPGPASLAGGGGERERVDDWFRRRTWQPAPWTVEELIAAKRGRTVSVVLPALDEESTVAGVVTAVRGVGALVDEVVVLDGGSTDRTAALARAAGARVVDRETALPGVAPRPGKGEVLWRSLAATSGDLVVFVDADLVDVEPDVVTGLLGPLLTVPGVQLVKGFYRRPLRIGNTERPSGGGRVTELMARPLLARFAPLLGGVVQPLGGEYAGTRELLESLPFAGGYGVEIGLLLDTLASASAGLDAIAQVDLGVRKHRNRGLADLGVMAQEVLGAVLHRVGVDPRSGAESGSGADSGPVPVELVQYELRAAGSGPAGAGTGADGGSGGEAGGRWVPVVRPVARTDRPPMRLVRAGAGRSPGRSDSGLSAARGTIVP